MGHRDLLAWYAIRGMYSDVLALAVTMVLDHEDFTGVRVKSGTLFDNILITDDPEYAKKFAEETWAKHKDAEKTAFDEAEKRRLEEESANSKIDDSNDDDSDDEDEADDDKADVVAEQTKDSDDEKPQDIKVSADEKPNSSKYDSSLCEEG
uniref:Calreticulin n=1 Tax=Oryza glumipatula TaxID=40148 RepID=A0A0E0AYY7_9ORYZ